jgi:hypothetical protein
MRVVKPSSASNSPQAMMARRRTMMGDGANGNLARRRQQAFDMAMQQMQSTTPTFVNNPEPVKRSGRPVSWHPSTHLQAPQVPMQQHIPQPDFTQYINPTPMPQYGGVYSGYPSLPPTPAVYSEQTSPLSTFSPLSLPFGAPCHSQNPPQYVSAETWNMPPQPASKVYSTSGSPVMTEPFPSYTGQSFQWDAFATNGFNNMCTAPPTPEDFQHTQQLQLDVSTEESIPYQPLEEPEEEGEVLVGMGLYDNPEKTESDPGLDNYRTSTSQLLGTTYRRGQGLKLEESWEPPASDDEDDDGDAEGEGDE